MIPLFIGLTLVNLLSLGVAASLGFLWERRGPELAQWHMLAGVLAALTCCAVHCIVFTYFIATAKWLQHAVQVKRLDRAMIEPTRSFKAQAFPAALLAMLVAFGTAILGAASDNYPISITWHLSAAIAAIAINFLVGLVEFGAIARNGRLIDRVLETIGAGGSSGAAA